MALHVRCTQLNIDLSSEGVHCMCKMESLHPLRQLLTNTVNYQHEICHSWAFRHCEFRI